MYDSGYHWHLNIISLPVQEKAAYMGVHLWPSTWCQHLLFSCSLYENTFFVFLVKSAVQKNVDKICSVENTIYGLGKDVDLQMVVDTFQPQYCEPVETKWAWL